MRLTWSLVLALQFAHAEKSEANPSSSRSIPTRRRGGKPRGCASYWARAHQVEDLPPELREAITRGRWRSRRWRGTLRGDARGIIVPPIPPQEIERAMLPADTIAEITTSIATLQLEPNTADIAVRPSASA